MIDDRYLFEQDPEIKQFMTELDITIDVVMELDEFDLIKSILPVFVKTNVFDLYEPRLYIRAEEEGRPRGLTDPRIYKESYDSLTKTLEVEVDRQDSDIELERYKGHFPGQTIVEIIERGHTYRWPARDPPYIPPRPFIKETERYLEKTKNFEIFLVEGLRKRGFDANYGEDFRSSFVEPQEDSIYGELPY